MGRKTMATFIVSRRAERGEKPKHLRQQGYVPMSIVDRDHKTHSIKARLADLQAATKGADAHGVIELQIEGEAATRRAILRTVTGDPLAHTVFTATFQEVADSDTIKADVPVVAVGHNDGADEDNIVLTAVTPEIKIRAQVSKLPDHIEVDVSKLAVGEHVNAGDVALPEGVELLSSPDATLFSVSRVGVHAAETEDEAATADTEPVAEATA